MRTASRSILTVAVAVAAGAGLVAAPVPPAAAADGYRWASPVDGDTFKFLNGRSVRLLGYDSPEVDQCGYDEAYAKMASLLRRPVKVVKRNGKDEYGRTLAYVRTRNGRVIGTVMLQRGLGVARYDALDGYAWHPKQKLYRSLDSTNGEIVCAEPEPDVVPSPEPTVMFRLFRR
jgi:endonuclease YncB( thermonuclease family)